MYLLYLRIKIKIWFVVWTQDMGFHTQFLVRIGIGVDVSPCIYSLVCPSCAYCIAESHCWKLNLSIQIGVSSLLYGSFWTWLSSSFFCFYCLYCYNIHNNKIYLYSGKRKETTCCTFPPYIHDEFISSILYGTIISIYMMNSKKILGLVHVMVNC